MSKISYAAFHEMIGDPNIPVSTIANFLTIDQQRSSAFSPRVITNDKQVEMNETQRELESIIDVGNAYYRAERQKKFKEALQNGVKRPVLVSEGDSWFQYPAFIDEIIDHLDRQYLIWSLGAAGDTLANMTGQKSEYMSGLNRWQKHVKGFLFSGGGNDVIGQDETGKPVLDKLLKQYDSGQCPAWHIERSAFDSTLKYIKDAYIKMFQTIRDDSRFEELPIFVHGYDYPFPYPFGSDDDRQSAIGAPDQWLGRPFSSRDFPSDNVFAREVLIVMIDALYAMLNDIAAQDYGHIFVINARGSMPNVGDWGDELHGTCTGFGKVADRFNAIITPIVS